MLSEPPMTPLRTAFYDLTRCPPSSSFYDPATAFPPYYFIPSVVAILNAAPLVGLPSISQSNFTEWLYRVSSLHDAGFTFLSVPTPDGPTPLRITPADIHLLLHATFNLIPTPDASFDAFIRSARLRVLNPHHHAFAFPPPIHPPHPS